MLTQKTKYGLKALQVLTRRYGQGPVLVAEIAREEGIPKKFLEVILLELKNRGIVQSKKGKGGGYFLGNDPGTISLGNVIRLLDGPLAPLPCVSKTAYRKCPECKNEDACGVRLVMKEVRDAMAGILDGTSVAELQKRVDSLPKKEEVNIYFI